MRVCSSPCGEIVRTNKETLFCAERLSHSFCPNSSISPSTATFTGSPVKLGSGLPSPIYVWISRPVPGSIASLRDTVRARLDSLLLHAEVVCEEYGQQVIEPWGHGLHWCEIVLQRPREAYQRMPGYDSLVAVTRAREFQRAGGTLLQILEEGLQEPAQDKSDLKPDK